MNDTPLMNKMDALLKKHRGSAESAFGPTTPEVSPVPGDAAHDSSAQSTPQPPHAWLPVLTDVIERGSPPEPTTAAPPPASPRPPVAEAPALAPAEAAAGITDTLAEQLMSELAPRLSEVMEKQVAVELRKNLDQTVSILLAQLDTNVREIVREAVEEKLKQPRNPPT